MNNDTVLKEIASLSPDTYGEFDESVMDTIINTILKEDNPEVYIPYLFEIFEKFPDAEFGAPGPFVHFIEKFHPNYLDILIESVKRKPTSLTVWMTNRILNSKLNDETRNKLLELLNSVTKNEKANELVIEQANEFIKFQRNQI